MPRMTITDVDGRSVEVTTSGALQAQLDRFEAEIDKLLPDLDGTDDAAGERALTRYNLLAAGLNTVVAQLPSWNEVLAKENRDRRHALAASIRERRRRG